MREQAGNQVRRTERDLYATREDFVKVFDEDMNGLYQLSFSAYRRSRKGREVSGRRY